jgi:uncharacterized protein YndB with AHSA1/START domain
MTDAASSSATQDIVVEEVLPHAPETIWKTLTTGELIDRWLMKSTGFEPVEGTPLHIADDPGRRMGWRDPLRGARSDPQRAPVLFVAGGHDANAAYGSRLDTIVALTLAKVDGGTRLRVVHSGFVLPKNAIAFRNMSKGWEKVVGKIGAISGGRAH